MTLTTATAAAQANVTVDTIRTWCRRGAVAARKISGRWVIEADSLARRIALGIRKKKPALTVENLIAVGGKRWQRGDKDRVYFNNWDELAGIEVTRYGTGNISWASYQGETVSNSQGYKLLACIEKMWFDVAEKAFYVRYGVVESRVATKREVFLAATAGIRAAVAAL
ncbi:helix-turn-helix domain-containing protein [Marinactinospora thermotolerans]|uniref:helix-turn-helix domain-containing protein n=1 Tax=Marinactinospora thermotolerans TaxID=531310 RepID=UPI003D9089E8